MLKDVKVSHVILGHSERRHIYNESNRDILEKVKLVHKYKINIVLCVGETFEERNHYTNVAITYGQAVTSILC